MSDTGIATSGDYRNFFERDGQRYSHLIDPRTGYPIQHDVVSVTVVHGSAMMADAWATALTVMGSAEALVLAEERCGVSAKAFRRYAGGIFPARPWHNGLLRGLMKRQDRENEA